MKLLLLGANGQVGFELQRSLAPLGEVVCATRSGQLPGGAPCEPADLADAASLDAVLGRARPDVVVNAAAYTGVDRAEDEPDAARRANAEAPAQLARWCQQRDAMLVHYSTDYVFDGGGARPYRENDAAAPIGIYGQTKFEGEEAIRASGARHLLFRTAWVYAARGQNFLNTMLRLGRERAALRIVADQRGAPTPARWIAAATALALARLPQKPDPAHQGLFHLSAAGEASWHEFALAIFEQASAAGVIDRVPTLEAILTADYPTRARRPAYSRLDCRRLYDSFGLRLPDWRRGVAEVLAELASSSAQPG
jgi:dTDP-4-dehydrorhamnose reductase